MSAISPDAAETLWAARWGEYLQSAAEVMLAGAPWTEIMSVLRDVGRLEAEQHVGLLKFGWKLKEKHNE